MKKITSNKLILLFSITYMVSYLTRINYGAVISEMEQATGFSKQALSLAVTGSFITYGAGQILSGVLGDKFSPKKLVLAGLVTTALMNLLLPCCTSYLAMTAVWSINGFAQALMWPPIVKLMVGLLQDKEYDKGVVRVSWGSSVGTIVIYLLAPLVISLSSWRGVFFFGAFCAIIMIFLWQKFCPEIENVKRVNEDREVAVNTRIITPAFCVVAVAIAICGMLRDGVATWMPSLISESFNLSSSSGILSGAVLPIFGMICYALALTLYRERFNNPIACAGTVFFAGALSCVLLSFVLGNSSILSVLSVALLNGTMHGVNLMLIGILPSFYAKTGKVSTVSGLLNSFVYIGSAVSTYGIAVLNEHFGWNITVLVWLIFAVLGTVVCFSVSNRWKKERMLLSYRK